MLKGMVKLFESMIPSQWGYGKSTLYTKLMGRVN